MRLAFYAYAVRLGWGLPPYSKELGLMFFQTPPQQGERLLLRGSQLPTVIRQVNHYHMIIDVSPAPEVQPIGR